MKKSMALLLLFLLAGCGTPSGGGMESTDRSGARVNSGAQVHTELAALYYERGQLGIALGEVEQALKADRDYAPAYNVRGLIHMTLREYQEADEDFRHGLSLDSADSEMHNNYGWFLCQRGREKESIPHFMSALKNPLYATPQRAYLNAGLCSRKIGNDSDADEFLQRALLLQPGLPQALLAMAELNFAKGDYSAAKKYFERYSENNDNLTAEQLWLAVRIERKVGDRNAEVSYGTQLRKRFPDANETRLFMYGD